MPNWGDYSNDLGFVHGMRVFSATWVVLGHSHMVRDVHASSDSIGFLKRIREDFPFTVQVNSFMAVETFLVITLIVPMAAVMGFIYILPAVIDGPMMREHRHSFEDPCDKNWWKMFTMTQNYVERFGDLCVPHFWYVAVDYQLAIISTIILAAIMPKWPKACMWLMGVIVVASSLATLIQTYVIDALPFGLIVTTDMKRISDVQTEIYIKPHAHAATLFVGVIFGVLAARRHRLSRLVQGAAWAVAAVLALAALLGVRTWTVGRQPERLESAFYGGLHRVSWALGIAWVMYACATGRGGFVTKILAWPIMYPLGRLSFALYLVHLLVLGSTTVLGRELTSQQPFLHTQIYLALVIMSYGFAIVVYLFIECPVAGLDNTAFQKVMPKHGNQSASKIKGNAQDLKAIQAVPKSIASTNLEFSPSTHQLANGFPDVTKRSGNGIHLNGQVNAAWENDISDKDSQADVAVISIKF
ncbi:nose resistant to fluoxetine protein 6-like [Dermacentor variabilis]|uniref:nose resistant to fluoxetine protein 6-like n=1 Tax=Dermacentor variabilis TaxID=34621 RepID=UPI003F5AFCFF